MWHYVDYIQIRFTQSHARKILLILMISNLKLTTSVDSPRDCLGFLLCYFVFWFLVGFFVCCLLAVLFSLILFTSFVIA